MVQPESNQDIDIMPQNQEVTQLASLDLKAEKVPSDEGDRKILEDNLEEEMHNISFEESQHRVVKSCKVPTQNAHVSHVQFEE